jgi:LPS-assembly protein
MLTRWSVVPVFAWLCLSSATTFAQQAPEQKPAETPRTSGPSLSRMRWSADRQVSVSKDHLQLVGDVELPIDDQTLLSADQIDMFFDTNRLVAEGNVVFAGAEGRISAERIEYNVETSNGTFTTAFGIMSLGPQADRKQFGNQDADVYFFGETIEKLGARTYRITRGGFSTCVQPTPRWEMTSRSVELNLDDYAFARDTVLRVKGVPLMYLPVIYYPIQKSGRATGFLLPTYGSSTTRGQALSNAFFWAIGRSQDATFFHDWFTRAGQGAGGEYRYVASPQSAGNFRFYRFSQKEASYSSNGITVPASTDYQVTSAVNQTIFTGLRARARVEYFTSLLNQQLYHQDIYQASQNRRTIEAGLTGNHGPISTSALYQRQESFSDADNTNVYGSTPRVTASLSPQRLFNAPIYATVNSEYAFLPNQSVSNGLVTRDDSFGRLDVTPTVRIPMSRLTFLSINTSATYRTTRYSRSVGDSSALSDRAYVRQYSSLRSDIVGPVFTKIWDRPTGFAERFKHVIEPAFTVDFTSRISDYASTPRSVSDVSDFVVSGNTKATYGLTNRMFYRARTVDGARGQTREFVTVGIQQTYYSNPLAAPFDTTYQSLSGVRSADLSPISLSARVSPTMLFDANSRLEYDVSGRGLMSVSSGGTLNMPSTSANVTFSHSRSSGDFVSGGTTLRWLDSRATLAYSVYWNITQSSIQSQHIALNYLAQCCGIQVELQKYNYSSSLPLPSDTRFNFGFVLAGLGTFSNFFGAFGGAR